MKTMRVVLAIFIVGCALPETSAQCAAAWERSEVEGATCDSAALDQSTDGTPTPEEENTLVAEDARHHRPYKPVIFTAQQGPELPLL